MRRLHLRHCVSLLVALPACGAIWGFDDLTSSTDLESRDAGDVSLGDGSINGNQDGGSVGDEVGDDAHVDAPGSCLTYFDDEAAFAAATSAFTMRIEDFTRKADGSSTPNAFVIQNGSYFYERDRLTFSTLGVNSAPGSTASTLAVDGNTPSTIMSQIAGVTARDAIVASFTANVAAVAFQPSDDEGMQVYTLAITTTSGASSFPVAATSRTPFIGVVNGCGKVIVSATLRPPTPSHWWRLDSVRFGS